MMAKPEDVVFPGLAAYSCPKIQNFKCHNDTGLVRPRIECEASNPSFVEPSSAGESEPATPPPPRLKSKIFLKFRVSRSATPSTVDERPISHEETASANYATRNQKQVRITNKSRKNNRITSSNYTPASKTCIKSFLSTRSFLKDGIANVVAHRSQEQKLILEKGGCIPLCSDGSTTAQQVWEERFGGKCARLLGEASEASRQESITREVDHSIRNIMIRRAEAVEEKRLAEEWRATLEKREAEKMVKRIKESMEDR